MRRRKTTTKTSRSDFKVFESIHSMLSFLGASEGKYHSNATYNEEWYGSKTYHEAEERILQGDDQLAKMLRGSNKLDIRMPSTATKKVIRTGVCGFAPHVPNFLAGVPNNMIFVEERKIQKRVLTVVYGCNTWAGSSPEDIAKVSARVVSCIMSLERKGYRIQLYASNAASDGSRKAGFVTKLKDAGQQIDVLKMAFPLLSAAWNRRFGFRFREICGWGNVGGSLDGAELREFLNEENFKYDVALSFYDAEELTTVEQLEQLFIKNINTNNK